MKKILLFVLISLLSATMSFAQDDNGKLEFFKIMEDGEHIGYKTIKQEEKRIVVKHYKLDKKTVVRTVIIDLTIEDEKYIPYYENGKLVGWKVLTHLPNEDKIVVDFYNIEREDIFKTIIIDLRDKDIADDYINQGR